MTHVLPQRASALSIKTIKRPSMHKLSTYTETFRQVVLNHIQTELDPIEWIRLRALAADGSRWVPGLGSSYKPLATAVELLQEHVVVDTASVYDSITNDAEETEAGLIDGLPVYYLKKSGVYIFGETFHDRETLSFWITTPAYPPGW